MSTTPESVRQLLSSQDLGDRIRAVNQLRQLEPARAFELAQTAISDSSPRIRYAAVSQMASLGRQDLQTTFTLLRERLLNDPEPDVQAAAADSLGGLQLTEAFEDLQRLYETTPEWLVKFSIVAALGELGDRRSFELLENALNAGEELIRMAAISSFGELGDVRAVPLLVPHAAHADWQIRYRVAQALARLGGESARSTLERLAQDEVEQVADAAKTGIGHGA